MKMIGNTRIDADIARIRKYRDRDGYQRSERILQLGASRRRQAQKRPHVHSNDYGGKINAVGILDCRHAGQLGWGGGAWPGPPKGPWCQWCALMGGGGGAWEGRQ